MRWIYLHSHPRVIKFNSKGVHIVQLIINGDPIGVPETVTTISQLLLHLGLEEKIVIVELNQVILEKANHLNTTVSSGDRIEIVHFVGGG
ncbi:sulfur carrier protein [Paenibacillus sp. GP183]|jgi:sulfur carrier protein|nr:sulfur carrier protein [Paenibacillus sp. GP183]